ncbi:MAG: insulinase family protein [Holosporaceae bacterium]|jgi:zinc protease|nr:insulinase family protein [Holosporaceae bacterium]
MIFSAQARYSAADFILKNGLRVICIEKKSSPIIFFSIWYKCGSKDDAISRSGVAHYLEHMAFASNKMEFNNFLEDVGAFRNAFTSINVICFHEVVPKENIETVFEHEAMRMTSLDIDDNAFLSEKNAILEERSMRIDNDPNGEAQESFLANIFNREIGGIEIIGWRHEIESIQKDDLYQFHDKWFAPNNAVIVISGDFDLQKIKKLAEKYFGEIPQKEICNISEKKESTIYQKEVKCGSPKNGSLSLVEYLYAVPFLSKQNLRKAIALEVAFMAINRPTFFVKKILKDVMNRASKISFGYTDRIFQYDIASVEFSASSIDDLYEIENIWRHLKKKVVEVGISKSELDAVKRQYLLSLAYKKDDIVSMSNYFGWLLVCGYSMDEIQSIDDIIQSISEKECNDLLSQVFSQDPCAILRVVPKGYDRE